MAEGGWRVVGGGEGESAVEGGGEGVVGWERREGEGGWCSRVGEFLGSEGNRDGEIEGEVEVEVEGDGVEDREFGRDMDD